MIYEIPWNNQRDNNSAGGLFPGSWQCFTTSQWMKGSHYTGKVNALDDKGLFEYLNNMEISIPGKGIGEELTRGTSIKKWSSIHWEIQQKAFTRMLNDYGIEGYDIFNTLNYEQIRQYILYGPVTVGTYQLGGLPGGHIILCIGIDRVGSLIFNDPYGDARTGYKEQNGAKVIYPKSLFTQEKFKVLYWR